MSRRAIARRELASLSREKTIVLALVIQLVIAGFSSFLVVGLTALYDPGAIEDDTVTIGLSGETQEQLVEVARDTEVDFEAYDTPAEALEGFEDGTVDAVVTGQRVDTGDGSRIEVRAVAPAEDLRTTLIVVSLRDYLSAVEASERTARVANLERTPLEVPEESDSDSGQFFGFTYTILLPLLLFLPPFISGSLAVDSITEELERGTFELLQVAPVSLVEILDGKAGAMILLAPAQALLWIGLLRFNGFTITNVVGLTALVSAVTVITVAVGMAIALATGTRRRAQLLYSALVLALFGISVVLPEHPASTVALLATDSATLVTFGHVVGIAAVAALAYVLVRWQTRRGRLQRNG